MILHIKDKIKNLNIVIGCPIGCRYCYARANCRRFRITEDFSRPVFFESKLRLFDTREPRLFLLTGMSDPAFWRPEWMEQVLAKAASTPRNTYLFLTKRPERMDIQTDLDNLWFGVTVTCSAEKERLSLLRRHVRAKHNHATFEPLSDAVGRVDLTGYEWVVLGTETGRCKGRIPSEKEWIDGLAAQAAAENIPVFMKEDLWSEGIVPEDQMIQQFPKEFG